MQPEHHEDRTRAALVGTLGPAFVFSIAINLLMLTGPLFMLQVYDRVLASRSEPTLVALFGLVCILFIAMGLLDYARGRLLARTAIRIRARLDKPAFATLLDDKNKSSLNDLDALQNLFTAPVTAALFDLPWTPLFLILIFSFHPLMGGLAIFGGSILVLSALANSALSRRTTATAKHMRENAWQLAAEAERGSETLRAMAMQPAFLARWRAAHNMGLSASLAASDTAGIITSFSKIFRLFMQSAMLALGAWLVLQNALSAGTMITSSILLGRALAPVEQTIAQWPLVQRAWQAWTNLTELRSLPAICAAAPDLPVPKPTLRLDRVTVRAGISNEPALTQISFALGTGQVLGVIGNNGAGKSTLARTLVGALKPASGDLRFGGATLDQFNPWQLGCLIGYVPQTQSLFAGTVAENISRFEINHDPEKLFAAAKRAHAHEMILSLPNGYASEIDPYNPAISGGQLQRIALARALYSDPVLLVLDEPTSALDRSGIDALNQTLADLKTRNRSAVIMTHQPQAISQCDRLIVLEQGRITADGSRDAILQVMLVNSHSIAQSISPKPHHAKRA